MSIIQNISELEKFLNIDQILKLEKAAARHKEQSNISFTAGSADHGEIQITTVQGETSSGKYASEATLVKRTEDLFRKIMPGYKITVATETHLPSPATIVDTLWIEKKMQEKGVRIKQIAFDTGIDRASISDWVTGKRSMGQIVKAMFYFYLSK